MDDHAFIESLKVIVKYLKTPAGLGSTVPGVVGLSNIALKFIPIPALVRPTIYVIILFGVLYVFYYEAALYATATPGDILFTKMQRRASVHFAIATASAFTYFLGLSILDVHMPSREDVVDALIWLSAMVAVVALVELTRSIIILGLKSFIANRAEVAARP